MSTTEEIQNTFLAQLKQNESAVSIFLVSGIKLHGVISDFDDHVIMLKSATTQMIYKRAISTVVPATGH